MSYQPPLVVQRRGRPLALRPVVGITALYVTMAVCYSIGYGQAISSMAATAAGAARIVVAGDYSDISGIGGVLSPLIRLGVADAARFRPKNLLFGVFTWLWATHDDVAVARLNVSVVYPVAIAEGLSPETLRLIESGEAARLLEKGDYERLMKNPDVTRLMKQRRKALPVDRDQVLLRLRQAGFESPILPAAMPSHLKPK